MSPYENGVWTGLKYVVCGREGSVHVDLPRRSKMWVCGQGLYMG